MCDLQKLALGLILNNVEQAQVQVFCFDTLIGSLLCKPFSCHFCLSKSNQKTAGTYYPHVPAWFPDEALVLLC